jgi:hypothetical protein
VAYDCGVGVNAQLQQKSRLVAYDCGVGMDIQPTQPERAMVHSDGVMTPACRVGMDFGSTD